MQVINSKYENARPWSAKRAAHGTDAAQELRAAQRAAQRAVQPALAALSGSRSPQGSDLLLASSLPLLPRHAAVNANGLELFELIHGVLEYFLLGLKICFRLGNCKFGVGLVRLLCALEVVLI